MKQLLYTDIVEDFCIVVDNVKYSCVDLLITYAMNAIPSASVTIARGINLEDKTFQDPTVILAKILCNPYKRKPLLKCSIYEGDDLIFRGVITAGMYVAKAGNSTTKLARLQCMHLISRLYNLAVLDLQYIYISNLLGKVNNALEKRKPNDGSDASSVSPYLYTSISSEQALQLINSHIVDATILLRINNIFNYLVIGYAVLKKNTNSFNELVKKYTGTVTDLNNYFYCDYKIADLAANTDAKTTYNKLLFNILLLGTKRAPLFQVLAGSLTSIEYMLNIVPRFRSKGFKFLICPSHAWTSDVSMAIDVSETNGVSTPIDAMSNLTIPDVFIVSFKKGMLKVSAIGTAQQGAFSPVNLVQQAINNIANGLGVATKLAEKYYRCKFYNAPRWLDPACIRERDSGKTSTTTIPKSSCYNKKEISLLEKDRLKMLLNIKTASLLRAISNKIAQALYVHLYGSNAACQLLLLPDLRFGRQEDRCLLDNIGNIVQFYVSESDTPLVGVLDSTSFHYTGGTKSTISYSAHFSRVRIPRSGEESIDSPMYTRS